MYERRLAWRLFVTYSLVMLAALLGLGWYGSFILDEALASGLHALWADPAQRERLGRAGYDGVRTHYTIAKSADRLIEAYESLTSEASTSVSKGAVLRDSA